MPIRVDFEATHFTNSLRSTEYCPQLGEIIGSVIVQESSSVNTATLEDFHIISSSVDIMDTLEANQQFSSDAIGGILGEHLVASTSILCTDSAPNFRQLISISLDGSDGILGNNSASTSILCTDLAALNCTASFSALRQQHQISSDGSEIIFVDNSASTSILCTENKNDCAFEVNLIMEKDSNTNGALSDKNNEHQNIARMDFLKRILKRSMCGGVYAIQIFVEVNGGTDNKNLISDRKSLSQEVKCKRNSELIVPRVPYGFNQSYSSDSNHSKYKEKFEERVKKRIIVAQASSTKP